MSNNREVVLIVLNNFLNDSRVLKEAATLQDSGYRVKVIALHEEPLKICEDVNGIDVIRLRLFTRNWPRNFIIQLFKYVEFVARAVQKSRRADIIHCNDLETLLVGVLVKGLNRQARVVYDAHEYETETIGLRGIRKKLCQYLEKILIRFADQVITVSDSIAREYERNYDITRPMVILNAPRLSEIEKTDILRKEHNIKENTFIFLTQGVLTAGRGIETILDVASQQTDDYKQFVFMGDGELKEQILNKSRDHSHIHYHPFVSPDKLLGYTSSADCGIAYIDDSCLSYRYCLPNKLFEYVMAGLPVICSDLPEMRKFIELTGVGVVASNRSSIELLSAMNVVMSGEIENLKENLKLARNSYNWSIEAEKLKAVYDNLKIAV